MEGGRRVRDGARVAKVVCRDHHLSLLIERNERNCIVRGSVANLDPVRGGVVLLVCLVLLYPLLQHTVHHGVVVEEDWVVGRGCPVPNYSHIEEQQVNCGIASPQYIVYLGEEQNTVKKGSKY